MLQLWNDFPIDECMMIYKYRIFELTFPIDEHMMIYTCRNFGMTFPIDESMMMYTFYKFELINAFDKRLMIYTYRNFKVTFPLTNLWWYRDNATLKWLLSYCWTPDDVNILRLLNSFPI